MTNPSRGGKGVRAIRPAPRLTPSSSGVEISRYMREWGLDLEDPEDPVGYREWYSIGETLFFMYDWTPFAIGDWLNYGERVFGETYAQAVKLSGRKIKTLYNLAGVARQFPPDIRRAGRLDAGHHEVLMGLPKEEKVMMLDLAEKMDEESGGNLTVHAWREHVYDYKRR